MLFASAEYLFVFLPLVVVATAAAVRLGGARAAMAVLIAASLVFYGWHDPAMVALLLAGMAVNYALGVRLAAAPSRGLLALGIALDLAVLGWFKYMGFFAGIVAGLGGQKVEVSAVALPLAISFLVFQQIAWLVDCRAGRAVRLSPLDFGLFVAFFPQLLAGPIVRAGETPPQFAAPGAFRIDRRDLGVGVALLALGLFKKVGLADGLAPLADSVFQASGRVGAVDAWGGALAYTLQIYFDFSGLSDMAIGSARLVGIRLPANFLSPYRATSISEFWQRWHVSLSRFLRDYLYISLGGNRRGQVRHVSALVTTMMLGGLWHGAGWTFVTWGALHGVYLAVYHFWRRTAGKRLAASGLRSALSCLLTVVAVAVAWVFFRAASFTEASGVLAGMAGLRGLEGLAPPLLDGHALAWIGGLLAAVWVLPNSLQWLADLGPCLPSPQLPAAATPRPFWRQAVFLPAVAVWGAVALLIVLHRGANTAPFLYMVF
ncbi:MAG: MBOAT family protein [Alphaproteobacteria bacterium]